TLDHLARHRAVEAGIGDGVEKSRARPGEAELQRVAIEQAQPFDLLVVVERPLAGDRLLAQGIDAENAFLVEPAVVRASRRRVEEPLPASTARWRARWSSVMARASVSIRSA